MNALDSPLEALALDFLSFGLLTVVNNVWTWVAVLTAAVSVWKFRASSTRGRCPDEASLIATPVERLAAVPPAAAEALTQFAAAPSSPCTFHSEGRTSGKFTFYYDRPAEVDVRNDDGDGEDDGEDGNVEGEKQRLRDGWEVTMRMRMGDHMGYYRYQDLTVLDGSVVRLWEGCRRRGGRTAAPLNTWGGGEGCIAW